MSKKLVVFAIVLVSFVVSLEFGCAGKGLKAKIAIKKTVSVEATSATAQGMKTYVSKWGFSVSYPAEWAFEEIWHNNIIPEDKKGLLPFNIYDSKNTNIDIIFSNRGGDVLESPNEIMEKLDYLAKNEIMKEIYQKKLFEIDGNAYCLVEGVLKGKGNFEKKNRIYVFFYVPKSNTIEVVEFGDIGEQKIMELMENIRIKIMK